MNKNVLESIEEYSQIFSEFLKIIFSSFDEAKNKNFQKCCKTVLKKFEGIP